MGETDVSASAPTKVGRRVALEPLNGRHIERLHELALQPEQIKEWPLYGRHLSLDEFDERIWSRGDLHHAIVRADDGAVLGLVQLLRDDIRSGNADVAVYIDAALWMAGWPMEGVIVFVDWVFRAFEYRKLYFFMTAHNYARTARLLADWMVIEATFKDHAPRGEGFEDAHLLALYRRQWFADFSPSYIGGQP